ncbi:O-antigen ligase family protein [Lentibacillus sp. Marseille-P4043]|uniref:O-antigen ligase family protein n=1 Tax=Lentibacillus sp. Marseille-P4043 TaxID=2040293 RepID=UPI000D0BDE82|nr:O-antigen ligase family protein [Lentibacillus sp. Marseille-P4043]
MDNRKNFLYFIGITIAILVIGLFLPTKFAMVISAVYFAAVTWLKPKWLIPLLLIYFPFRPFLTEINDGLKLAGDIGIIVLFVRVLYEAVKQKDYKSIFTLQWYEWAYLLFCVVGAISALSTGVTLIAIIFQLRKFLMLYLLFYGVKRLSWEKYEIMRLLKLITGVAAILSLHGFVEKLSQRQWLLPKAWMEQFISPTNFERIYGLLGNPNSMGLFMFVSMVASVVLLRMTKEKRWYIPLVLSFGTFLLTYSRGSWIGLVVSTIAILLIARNKELVKQVVIACLAGYVLVFLPINYADQLIFNALDDDTQKKYMEEGGGNSLGDRFSSSFDEEQLDRSLNTGRIFFIKKGFGILMDHPVIGTGFGTFGDSAALVYSSPIYDDYGLEDIYYYMGKDFYSDNQYIQIIVQTGIVGTLLFAVFLLNMVYRIWTTRKTYPNLANVAIMFWLFICIVGVVYNVWENQVFPIIFLALIAWLETVKSGKSEPLSATYEGKEEVK